MATTRKNRQTVALRPEVMQTIAEALSEKPGVWFILEEWSDLTKAHARKRVLQLQLNRLGNGRYEVYSRQGVIRGRRRGRAVK